MRFNQVYYCLDCEYTGALYRFGDVSQCPRVPWKRVIQAIRNGEQVDRHKKDDKLFITEIINDLYRNGFVVGGKACTMLQDWAIELRESSRAQLAASRLKRTFNNEIGAENW